MHIVFMYVHVATTQGPTAVDASCYVVGMYHMKYVETETFFIINYVPHKIYVCVYL